MGPALDEEFSTIHRWQVMVIHFDHAVSVSWCADGRPACEARKETHTGLYSLMTIIMICDHSTSGHHSKPPSSRRNASAYTVVTGARRRGKRQGASGRNIKTSLSKTFYHCHDIGYQWWCIVSTCLQRDNKKHTAETPCHALCSVILFLPRKSPLAPIMS